MSKKKISAPTYLTIEVNFDYLMQKAGIERTITAITIDGKESNHFKLENLMSTPRFPFDPEEVELFTLGVFGVQTVQTNAGTYLRVGGPSARLQDDGCRGGAYRIVHVEYRFSE